MELEGLLPLAIPAVPAILPETDVLLVAAGTPEVPVATVVFTEVTGAPTAVVFAVL